MIRKLTLFATALLCAFALAACGGGEEDSANNPNEGNGAKDGNEAAEQQAKMQEQIEKGLVDDDQTVATVNGTEIKGKQYNAVYQTAAMQQMAMTPQNDDEDGDISGLAKEQALNSLVGQELILQDAEAKGYEPTQKKIDQHIEKQYGGKEKLKEIVDEQEDLTMDQAEEMIAESVLYDMYVDKEIGAISDDEIKSFYEEATANMEDAPKLEEVKEQIEQSVQQQKVAKIIEQLKKDSDINIAI